MKRTNNHRPSTSPPAGDLPALAPRARRVVNYVSIWSRKNHLRFDRGRMEDSLRLACRWLTEKCTWTAKELPREENPYHYQYRCWSGVAREYNAGKRAWHVFAPVWHTGQLIKALVLAHSVLEDPSLLDAARRSAQFLLHARVSDPHDPDFGVIVAQENGRPEVTNTSCLLEGLDGLIHLGEQTGDEQYWQVVLRCLEWVEKNLFIPREGLFYDDYDFTRRQAGSASNTLLHCVPGRPLLDDGVFLKGFRKSGRTSFREVFYTVADRLLEEEDPPGNWIRFPPCDQVAGLIHPRQAYWWGRPMVLAWKDSGDEKYLHCAQRVGNWYVQAQRRDGGMFRLTDRNFNTSSYGQATSGVLAAALLWRDLIVENQGDAFRNPFKRALKFGHSMQFTRPSDPNLTGAILEKTEPPDGTDRLPYQVRDLGTIFYVQSLALGLKDHLL